LSTVCYLTGSDRERGSRLVLECLKIAAGLIVACLAVGGPAGQEPLSQAPGTEFVGAVNLRSKNLKVDGTVFIPSTVRRADAVIVIVNWGTTQELIFDRSPWRETLARNASAVLLHVRFTEMVAEPGPRAEGAFWDAGSGAGEGLLALLKQLSPV
jgi:hypothetical protein